MGYIRTPSSHQLTAAERDAAAAAARWASKREARPWRIGDVQGGGPRRRRPRKRGRSGPRILVGLLALVGVALVGYTALSRSTAPGPSTLRLPGVGRALETAGTCRASIYP